ncbi:hypothetical protein Tco_0227672 [Tanacetum coccineum]
MRSFRNRLVRQNQSTTLDNEARDMDTKLLSASESNNTLARCWFRWNVIVTSFGSCGDVLVPLQVASSGWPLVSAVPGLMTHLVASLTLDSARSCVIQGAFLTQGKASKLLGVDLVAVVVVVVLVVVVVGGSSIIKLSFVIIGSLHRIVLGYLIH